MSHQTRIEATLTEVIGRAQAHPAPPHLATAMAYAVFPGGARVRPRICLSVADACESGAREVADLAAAAIELMHCASLAHDDLPSFDDADVRRGKPSLHRALPLGLAPQHGLRGPRCRFPDGRSRDAGGGW